MDRVIEQLRTEFVSEDARYAYADSVANSFLVAQIKALREARKLTQDELATLIGTQQSGISRWQNSGFANCKVETLRKFAKAFGVRLKISFEEFGSLPDDVREFTEDRLAPRKFEDDPAFFELTIGPIGECSILNTTVDASERFASFLNKNNQLLDVRHGDPKLVSIETSRQFAGNSSADEFSIDGGGRKTSNVEQNSLDEARFGVGGMR